MTEEEKHNYKQKENKRQSQLTKLQIACKRSSTGNCQQKKEKVSKTRPSTASKNSSKEPIQIKIKLWKGVKYMPNGTSPLSPKKSCIWLKKQDYQSRMIMKNNVMEIPASLINLVEAVKKFFFRSDISSPCLELKMKWLYGISLGKRDYVNITLPCTCVKHMQFSKKHNKRMKKCAACLLSASLDQNMFFFQVALQRILVNVKPMKTFF